MNHVDQLRQNVEECRLQGLLLAAVDVVDVASDMVSLHFVAEAFGRLILT